MEFNLNVWYNPGDMAWMIAASALIWLIVPGIGFLFGGFSRRKAALSMIWVPLAAATITMLQVPFRVQSLLNG